MVKLSPRRVSVVARRCALVAVIAAVACKDDVTQPPVAAARGPRATGSRIPANSVSAEQLGMGGLERVALHVVRALQEPTVRKALAIAMRDPANRGLGIDLNACSGTAIAAQLFQAGERHGGGLARGLCEEVGARGDLLLYMEPKQLQRWDGTAPPIVTALVNPNSPLPPHLMGYRSPNMLLDIGNDPKLVAPILVIVPIKHPARLSTGLTNPRAK